MVYLINEPELSQGKQAFIDWLAQLEQLDREADPGVDECISHARETIAWFEARERSAA